MLLTSAGIKNDDIAQTLTGLVGKPLSDVNIVFVITPSISFGGDKRWVIENLVDFERYNFKSIDIIDIVSQSKEAWVKRFEDADVICFGGGNEIYLAEVFENVGMKECLLSQMGNKVYMGISAGSMVAGALLTGELYPLIFTEEDFGKVNHPGMGLYDFCFIPHLNSPFFASIRKERLESLKESFVTSAYSTDDETAILVEGDRIEIIGKGEPWIFRK